MTLASHLCLFFTQNVSLATWDGVGTLERESAIYQGLLETGVKVSFVTYGDKTDLKYAKRIPGIQILCNQWQLPTNMYLRWLHLIHGPHLRRVSVIKTNQIYGSDIALRAARFWRKPLIVRGGFMWSFYTAQEMGIDSQVAIEAKSLEARVFPAANQIVVTTEKMRASVVERFPEAAPFTRIIPNYVNTDQFHPGEAQDRDIDVLYVGRLSKEKNIESLLEALRGLDANITLIGQGSLENNLRNQFSDLSHRVNWQGKIPNATLPGFMNRSKIFVLPSFHEGHPKTIIEAMSCGLAVIGANSPGIRELIRHGDTGWLCDPSPEGIREAIQTLLEDSELRTKLGQNACSYAKANFSLHYISQLELDLFREVAAL